MGPGVKVTRRDPRHGGGDCGGSLTGQRSARDPRPRRERAKPGEDGVAEGTSWGPFRVSPPERGLSYDLTAEPNETEMDE